jgi:amino acid permease
MCKSFKVAECHQNNLYTVIILILLFPVYCLRSMNNIGYFSAIALFFTFIAVILILVICGNLITMEPSEIREEKHIHITDEDRDYNYFDLYMVPVVMATLNSLFEGT